MAKFYLTTAIPYVNAPPHIGHALEFLQADVVARKARLQEKEVFFLTGSDDNGLKNYRTARDQGEETQVFVDENAQIFKDLLLQLNISNDDFIRTSDRARHWPTAQKLWSELENAGDIYKKFYRGFYCVGHETFHLEGDLVEGKCPDYPGREIEVIEEENYFFRLSKYGADLKQLISSDELKIVPESRKNEILSLIERGLEDVSFSRPKEKLPWGIPVPGDESHIMYVWCDALTNYLSGVDYAGGGAKFQKFWPPDLQIIGKDILRFHAAIWPAMLLAAKLPLPKVLLVHGFVTSAGEKMSKSLGNVIDPLEFYFLLREIPTTGDGDFTQRRFLERYNTDLANGLGNLASRLLTLGEKFGREIELRTDDLEKETAATWKKYEEHFSRYQFHEALGAVWQLLARVDAYLNEKEPWKLLRGREHDREEGLTDVIGHILSSAILALGNVTWLLRPFLPETSEKLLFALGLNQKQTGPWAGRRVTLKKTVPLFPRREA